MFTRTSPNRRTPGLSAITLLALAASATIPAMILGTILGVLIIGVLRNGLILLGISPFWQTTIIGLVILFAVGLDKWTEQRRYT